MSAPWPAIARSPWKFRAGDGPLTQTYRITRGGEPDNLDDGWETWLAQWRPHAGSATVVDLKVDVPDPQSGEIEVTLFSTMSAQMVGEGLFDVQARKAGPDGEPDVVNTYLQVPTLGDPSVTRGVLK